MERQQLVLKQQEKECQQYEARIDALTKERDELERAKELTMKKVGALRRRRGGAGRGWGLSLGTSGGPLSPDERRLQSSAGQPAGTGH